MDQQAVAALIALARTRNNDSLDDAADDVRRLLNGHGRVVEPLLQAIADQVREIVELQRLAGTDALTGAAHRRVFEDALEREVARHNRQRTGLGLLLLDLDDLKGINDSLGHAAGDRAIMAVARVARATLRATDLVARLGGDEFAVLLPGVDEVGARDTAERLRMNITDITIGDRTLGVSVGVATAGTFSVTSEGLLALADADLYDDKRSRKRESQVELAELADRATVRCYASAI